MGNLTRQEDAIELASKLNLQVSEKNGVVFLLDYCSDEQGLKITTLVDCNRMEAHCIIAGDFPSIGECARIEKRNKKVADNFLSALKKYTY